MKRRALVPLAAIALSACQNLPEAYAPPVQRQPFEDFRPYRVSRIVDMADADAASHFVRDITGASGGTWRWTGQRPAVKVRLRSTEKIRYVIDFSVADATFAETGPVRVSFFVNDRLLGKARYTRPGERHFEKPVPAEWLTTDQDTIVAAEVDKVWVAPQDGAKLGLIVSRIGLTQ